MTAQRTPDMLIGAFLEEGLVELPDRAFDAVRHDIHRTHQRAVLGPWKEPSMTTITRLAVAAVVLVAVGVAWINFAPTANFGTAPTPSPTASPMPVTGPNRELEPGTYSFDYGAATGQQLSGAKIFVSIPGPGWTNWANFAVDKNYGPTDADAGASFVVWHITSLTRDPCTDHMARATQPGSGIDEILEALADQAGLSAGPITDVIVDGYTGKFVDLTVTADVTDCPGGFFPWVDKFVQGPNELLRVYALDVEDDRLTFFLRIPERTEPIDRGELQAIVDSVDIQP